MPSTSQPPDGAEPPPPRTAAGRRGQAARNDTVILQAAREVFLDDPKAPIAAVAERAGVGISALYRRHPGKEALLRQLCHDGLLRFIAEAQAAEVQPDPWVALAGFITRVVEADVHSLTVHLAGTFVPTPELAELARNASDLLAALVERARAGGRLRPDAVVEDVELVLEGCAAIRLPDHERTRQLRVRHLRLVLDGLSATEATPLPGPAPRADELAWRWRRQPIPR